MKLLRATNDAERDIGVFVTTMNQLTTKGTASMIEKIEAEILKGNK